MQTAIFYGASDDLIEVEGVKGADEFSAYNNDDNLIHGQFVLGGKMKIYAIYDGCWHFSIGPVDEDVQLPDWPLRYKLHELGYSVKLEIDVPDDVVLFKL